MTPMSKAIRVVWISILVAGFLLLFGGCTTRIADLTLISTKNIDLNNTQLDARKGTRINGEDCAVWPLGFIPLGLPNLEEAVDEALEKGKGNILVDQVTYRKHFYFVLASTLCIEVEGTVLNAP